MAKKRGHGEGTIYQRSDGKWVGQVTVDYDRITCKQKRATVYGKSKKEVMEKLISLQHQKQVHGIVELEKITVSNWLDRWLTDFMKGKLRHKTWESYDWIVRIHLKPSLGEFLLRKLQPADVQKVYNQKLVDGRAKGKGGVSPRTVRFMHVIMHSALDCAMKQGIIIRNIIEAVQPPRQARREFKPLTQEQVKQFLAVAREDRLYPAFLLEVGTGLRRGELLGLKWQDVNLEEGVLQVRRALIRTNKGVRLEEPKTAHSKRLIPLPQEVVKELKSHKSRQSKERLMNGDAYENNGYVFCDEIGNAVNPDFFTRRFSKILEEAGLPHVRFHDLRHGHATDLLLLGENPKVVQERLGHSSITVTMDIYSHVTQGMQEMASAKIDSILKELVGQAN